MGITDGLGLRSLRPRPHINTSNAHEHKTRTGTVGRKEHAASSAASRSCFAFSAASARRAASLCCVVLGMAGLGGKVKGGAGSFAPDF